MTTQEHDKKQFLQPTIKTISTVLGLPASIWLFDEEKKVFQIVAASGLSEDYVRNAIVAEHEAISLIKRVFETEKSIIVPNIQQSPFWKHKKEADQMNLKSAVASTLRIKTQVVGGLVVYIPKDKPCDLKELKPKVEAFATEIAYTLRQEKGWKTLNEVGQLINSEIQSEDIFKSILESAQRVLNCEHITIFLKDKSSGDLILKSSSTAKIKRERFRPGEGLAGPCSSDKKIFACVRCP